MIEGQVKEGDGPDLATIDCVRGKRVKAQVPLIIIRYPFPPEPRMSNWSSLTPELGTKMPTCLRTQQLSYLISTNQCHESSILHKFVMMPHREIPRHQEDCFSSQNKNCQLWSMQPGAWRLCNTRCCPFQLCERNLGTKTWSRGNRPRQTNLMWSQDTMSAQPGEGEKHGCAPCAKRPQASSFKWLWQLY